ncbi:uncharacterized protein LOC100887988 isoform X2 [Strongylocentrotus purpuratus]|uniref:VPS9 domain-containing protein n=1 Tax=Strongylocentrotus purpuratus TaxID=7668 RepID=A0A7M7N7F8_STRPU|nr:uncharacterized protein LOC100887988 isoform X2 [Strongylocentrotus purpuratus]
MYMYIRGRGSGCALGLQLPCSRSSSGISDGQGGCERWKIFGKISLRDGSVPQVDMERTTVRNGRKVKDVVEASITGLESAVWFKALLIDTVCLNLETKCIQWTNCNITECKERRQSHTPYHPCKHSHEWYLEQQKDNMTAGRDLEKGLEIARSILNGSNDNEHQNVLLLLHVYILPIIRLHASDRKHVSSALVDQEKAIANCNVQFLKLLTQHLHDDLRNAYVELDSCQETVDQCKGSLTKKRGSQYISDLVEARKSRDRVADYINKSLFVMEEVNLILSIKTIPASNELSDQHRAYIRIQDECKRHSKELHDLQRKKLLATSVREALVSTESELKQGRETTGIDISSDGLIRSTDVLGPSKLPEAWQTLPSKVSEALEKNKTLNDLHHDFSKEIVNQCREEIKGQPTIKRFRQKLDVSNSWKKLAKKHSGVSINHESDKMRRNTRHSLIEKRPTAHYQAVTQRLKTDVNMHFQEVTTRLASHLNLPFYYSRADLWTCYERAFFPGKISEFLKIYVYAYQAEIADLQKILPTSNLQDMQLDDEWILNILGLYAPIFNIHDDIEIGEDVTEQVIEPEKQSEKQDHDDRLTDIASVSGLGDFVKHRLHIDEDIRGRLESGVDVDLPEERLRRHASPHRQGESRQSWRNTQIIDCKWVTVPINIESAQSEPCIVQKQLRQKSVKLRDHEIAARHASLPEIKQLKHIAVEQYSPHSLFLNKVLDKPHPLLKKESSHLDDHIGDDSGVFNDHHDDDRHSQKGDHNSNLNRTDSSRTAMSVESNVSQPLSASDLCSSNPSMDASTFPQVVISSDAASDVEKMSITSSSHDPVNDMDVNIMIQGVDGEIKLDRELSRRCREKPAISEFLKRFSQAYHYFRVVLEESVPCSKLQWLLRCLKEVNSVAEKQASLISCGKQRMLSGDDLLTSLILFLIHGDPGEVTAFYPQLRFLEDFLPDFLDKGEIGFAVIQFESAYSYILRVERKKRESAQ